MRKVLSILVLAVAMLAGGAGVAQAQGMEPCKHEDSANCYWDAAERGNGQGDSFVDIDGVAYYVGAHTDCLTAPETCTIVEDGSMVTDASAAWALWDAVGAADLLPEGGAAVTFSGSWDGSALGADHVAVWDLNGNAYLFTLS